MNDAQKSLELNPRVESVQAECLRSDSMAGDRLKVRYEFHFCQRED